MGKIIDANLLEDLEVEEIAFVDEPADQDSRILIKKANLKPEDVIAWLEAMKEKEEDKDKHRKLMLLIGSLRSYFGLKKEDDEEDEEDEETDCEEKETKKSAESEEEIEKAGRTISSANAAKLKKIAATLADAAKQILEIVKEPNSYDGKYEYYQKALDAAQTIISGVIAGEIELDSEELEAFTTALNKIKEADIREV